MRIGSLCSGVGGLELGLEWAGLGETVFQVEIDPFCRRILGKHWPHAKQLETLQEAGKHNLPPADLICFGFPCQDLSSAGAQTGLSGARSGLFFECARIVAELCPEWVVVENVSSGARLWVDAVTGELARLGYACLPIPLSAQDAGALHQRARIFVVAHHQRRAPAHADREQLREQQQRHARRLECVRDQRQALDPFPGWGQPEPDVVRVADGVSEGLDASRVRALGNAVVPQCAEVVGWLIRELIESA